MLFKDIIGHKEIKQKLINSVKNNRISHAQLFLGKAGTGKLSLAIAYAQYVACTNKTDDDSCGVCKSCKKYSKLVHPDLHFVYPVVRTKKFTKPVSSDFLTEWRTFVLKDKFHSYNDWIETIGTENLQGSIYSQESQEIIKKLTLKTFESEYKIMIIWMAEKMNVSASNKLLKMIEEPPKKTLFILVVEDEEQIITTIRSRIQLIKINRLSEKDIADELEQLFPSAQKALIQDSARIADGSFSVAKKNVEQVLDPNIVDGNSKNFELFTSLMRIAYGANVLRLVGWVDDVCKFGREQEKSFFQYSLRLIRENFILNITPENKDQVTFLSDKEYQFSKNFNRFINKNNITNLYEEFGKAQADIERNAYDKIVFLDLALKIAQLLRK